MLLYFVVCNLHCTNGLECFKYMYIVVQSEPVHMEFLEMSGNLSQSRTTMTVTHTNLEKYNPGLYKFVSRN